MSSSNPSGPPGSVSSDELSAALPWEALGRHRYSVTGDVLFLCTSGPLEEGEIASLLTLLHTQVTAAGAALLLIDASGGLTMTAAARRYYAEWGRAHGFQPGSTAVLGASAATRAILTLITNGIGMILRQVPPIRFFKRRSEALAWLHSERARWRSVLATPT